MVEKLNRVLKAYIGELSIAEGFMFWRENINQNYYSMTNIPYKPERERRIRMRKEGYKELFGIELRDDRDEDKIKDIRFEMEDGIRELLSRTII